MAFRPGQVVTVYMYATYYTGAVTGDLPWPHHVQAGRTVPVRLNDGVLRFCDPDDVTRVTRIDYLKEDA